MSRLFVAVNYLVGKDSNNKFEQTLQTPCNYERFSEFIDDKELAEQSKGLIPANTSKCTNWALKTFELWKNARNQRFPNEYIPEDLFHTVDCLTPTSPILLWRQGKLMESNIHHLPYTNFFVAY